MIKDLVVPPGQHPSDPANDVELDAFLFSVERIQCHLCWIDERAAVIDASNELKSAAMADELKSIQESTEKATSSLKRLVQLILAGYSFDPGKKIPNGLLAPEGWFLDDPELTKQVLPVNLKPKPDWIHFYNVTDTYGEFSNFAAFPISLDGTTWPTSEHYFQAMKFAGTEHSEAIRQAKSPMIAARMGRDRKKPLRRDWESVKDSVMRDAVRAKFQQHPELRELLLSTGTALLVERTENDSYWGDGGDGSGKNRLGQILMDVRDELRTAE